MKEKALVLDEFWLKIIAILTMTFDHIGYFLEMYGGTNATFSSIALVCRILGRLSFPLFIFMLAEGLHKTHDRVNYLFRFALLWAVIFIVQFVLFKTNPFGFQMTSAQAFTDLLCYALFIFLIEKKGWWKALSILPLGFILLSYVMQVSEIYAAANNMTSLWTSFLPEWARCGYSLYGFLMFLGIYYAPILAKKQLESMEKKNGVDMSVFKEGKKFQGLINTLAISSIAITTVFFWGFAYFFPQLDAYFSISPQSYAILAIIPIMFYNGERGYNKKWFRYATYLYYPLHIALLALIFALSF